MIGPDDDRQLERWLCMINIAAGCIGMASHNWWLAALNFALAAFCLYRVPAE